MVAGVPPAAAAAVSAGGPAASCGCGDAWWQVGQPGVPAAASDSDDDSTTSSVDDTTASDDDSAAEDASLGGEGLHIGSATLIAADSLGDRDSPRSRSSGNKSHHLWDSEGSSRSSSASGPVMMDDYLPPSPRALGGASACGGTGGAAAATADDDDDEDDDDDDDDAEADQKQRQPPLAARFTRADAVLLGSASSGSRVGPGDDNHTVWDSCSSRESSVGGVCQVHHIVLEHRAA